jgi:hypothetical protein
MLVCAMVLAKSAALCARSPAKKPLQDCEKYFPAVYALRPPTIPEFIGRFAVFAPLELGIAFGAVAISRARKRRANQALAGIQKK